MGAMVKSVAWKKNGRRPKRLARIRSPCLAERVALEQVMYWKRQGFTSEECWAAVGCRHHGSWKYLTAIVAGRWVDCRKWLRQTESKT